MPTPRAPRAKPSPSPEATGMGEFGIKLGIVMGEVSMMKIQIADVGAKMDALPAVIQSAIREAMRPVAEQVAANTSDIMANTASIAILKEADAIEKGSLAGITSWRTKIVGGILALFGVASTAVGLWVSLHPGK